MRWGRTLAAGVVAVLAIGLGSLGAANYAGVCVPERRVVPDREFILAAIVEEGVGDIQMAYPAWPSPDAATKSVRVDRPDTPEAFLAANPGCCAVFAAGPTDAYERPTFRRRLFGWSRQVVHIRYVQPRPDDRGVLRDELTERYFNMNTCGEPLDLY